MSPAGRSPGPLGAGVVTASRLNVRPEPSTERPPLGSLPRGARIELLERAGAWYRIRAGELEGYVHGDFVRTVDELAAAGFLRERAELAQLPLEPPEQQRIAPAPSFTARERLVARAWNQSGGLLAPLSELIQIETGAALAVLTVESGGKAFGADGRMIIRFENHVFWREWGQANQALFAEHFRFDPAKPWSGHRFRPSAAGPWEAFHGKQDAEWRVFEFASALHEVAARRSISMGAPQIMGFNFAKAGYESVGEMFEAFRADVRFQILGLFDFIKGPGTTSPLLVALQRGRFTDFAAGYNGPANAAEYAARLEADFEIFRKLTRA